MENALDEIKNGDFIIIDTNKKNIQINPEKETIQEYKKIIYQKI